MKERKNNERVVEECLRILKEETPEGTQKWIKDNQIPSPRNHQYIQLSPPKNPPFSGLLQPPPYPPLLVPRTPIKTKKNHAPKCHEYARLVKHFSQWDYEFEYIYRVSLDQQLPQIGLYLRVREHVIHSEFNRGKKELMSGIGAQLEEWAGLAREIFRDREEGDVIDQFTTVVKNHYLQVKKSQSQKINGAQFLKICQIIDNGGTFAPSHGADQPFKTQTKKAKQPDPVANILEQAVLNGLSTQDRQLIRVLSYRDKNVARMLEQKHTKMVHLIGEEVYALRKDINTQKQKYIEVVEQKNSLLRVIDKLKESTLRYILNQNEASEFQVLQQLESYNKKHQPKATDVARTVEVINNRRLIEIIQREELQDEYN